MKSIVKEITIPVPVAEVYQKWITTEGLLSFIGSDAYIEFRINGPYEIYFLMDQEPGLRGSEECTVLDFEENRYLSFTWNVPPTFEQERSANYHSIVRIDFVNVDDSTTLVTLTNDYPTSTDNIEAIIQYFERAWELVLINLKDSFEKSTSSRMN